ncbi:MAG: glutamine amidotransferase [Phycisphaerales bacterium JB063]
MPDAAPQPVLYLGDTALTAAAAYLAGVMHRAGIAFDYCPSDEPIGDALRPDERRLIILSDYAASQLSDGQHRALVDSVLTGTGLLMIGGWDSYHGQAGGWQHAPIADLLPVTISDRDDRINHDQAAYLRRLHSHPTVSGLPWDDRPPAVGGYNRFRVKPEHPGVRRVLDVARRGVRRVGEGFQLSSMVIDPMLVVAEGTNGRGRVACLATDAAPHWVGPLVDWGTDNDDGPSVAGRVQCHAPGAFEVEVGQHYAKFFTQLVRWAAAIEEK